MLYSNSRLSTYENCPLQYKFRYIDKIDSTLGESIEAFMGKRVHETLEKLYTDLKFTKLNSLEDLLKHYIEEWDKQWNQNIRIIKNYDELHYKALGEKCITNYYNRYQPFDHDKTISIEDRVLIDLDSDGKYKLQGFIDRLAEEEDGTYIIHDYKTSGRLPKQQDADADRQLALYHIGVQAMHADTKKVKLVWHYLVFDKTLRSERSEDQLEELKQKTIDLIKTVEEKTARSDFPPRPSALCNWCNYRNICPMMKHKYKTEDMPLNKFLNEPGVVLVNKYSELQDKKKALEEDIEEVKDAIVKHSEENNELMLMGTGVQARIWSAVKTKFPYSNDPARVRLEALIKASGLWGEYSRLDTFALEKALDTGDFDKVLAEEIKKLGVREKITRIYLKKLKV